MVFPYRFSRDGTRLLVVAGERTDSWYHVYSVADRKPIHSWQIPEEDSCSTISATGKLVATGHPDGARVWSLPDTENPVFFPLQNLYSVDISPDESTLVASRVGSRLEVYD